MNAIDQKFSALADPTRRGIVALLAGGDATVNELVDQFHLTQPSISNHLKILESAGLISRTKVAQTRPCHLEIDALAEVQDWISKHRAVWEANFSRLDNVLDQLKEDS